MICYRLPYADEYCVITECECSQYYALTDLPDREGFLFAPFIASEKHPVLFFTGGKRSRHHVSTLPYCETPINTEVDEMIYKEYAESFSKALSMLRENRLQKIVLSSYNEVGVPAETPERYFKKACEMYPRMMVYMISDAKLGTWIGCTPEILLRGKRSHYETVALAGTMTNGSGQKWSAKNKCEQSVVADYIRQRITPYAHVIEEEGPFTAHAGGLIHLKTIFHFTPHQPFPIQKFLSDIHPTPAVCGLPKEEALRAISEIEKHDRAYYSGIVGMLNPEDETHLYVNLRCANISSASTTLYAGGGLLTSSVLQDEWKEICEKQKTIMHVFRQA